MNNHADYTGHEAPPELGGLVDPVVNRCVVCGEELPLTHAQCGCEDGPLHLHCAENVITVYQTSIAGVGNGPAYRNYKSAVDEALLHFESRQENGFSITPIQMTELKYRSLPEFNGY